MLPYTRVDIDQGSKAWLDWRNQGIGASDAPTIMGENPWKTPEKLLEEKCFGKSEFASAAMNRGVELEPEARRAFESKVGISVLPECLQSLGLDWLRASLDGLASDGSVAVEIKCGESVYRQSIASGKVPQYYVGQLQHILAVTGLQTVHFYCYLPRRQSVHVCMARDENYITKMLKLEALFWEELIRARGRM